MKKARWTSLGLFILSGNVIYESSKLPLWEDGYPMSGLFPMILGVLLALLSVLYLMRFGLRGKNKGVVDDPKSQWAKGAEPALELKMHWKKVLLSLGFIAAYPFLFMTVGYIIGTAIFLLLMCKFVEQLKILTTLIITIITITVSYAIFGLLLKVPLD